MIYGQLSKKNAKNDFFSIFFNQLIFKYYKRLPFTLNNVIISIYLRNNYSNIKREGKMNLFKLFTFIIHLLLIPKVYVYTK